MGGRTIQVSGFPSTVTAETVKAFLERHTEENSVYAVKIRPCKSTKGRPRVYAIVQFVNKELASQVAHRVEQRQILFVDGSYLRAFEMERDIVARPRTNLHDLQAPKLHLGCPLSDDRFSILWSARDVNVVFGFQMKRIHFVLSHENQSYKLDLSYDSIWEIKLHCSNAQSHQFLLIQVIAAPKIYELNSQGRIYDDPTHNYCRDVPDDQWVRTTDFTPYCSVGQSSALCLELPRRCNLPNISEYFVHYQEVRGRFSLEEGQSYSHSLAVVPIVKPGPGIHVPYETLFKINHMVQNGTLMGPTLDSAFYRLLSPEHTSVPASFIERALTNMSNLEKTCFSPTAWITEQYRKFRASNRPPQSSTIALEDGLVYVHRVQVTPSKVYFYGPEINVSNRVLRHFPQYINNFLRVSFVDEDCDKMYSTDLQSRASKNEPASVSRRSSLYWRILDILKQGISIGDKKFEFLAFSNSQLRENSTWMFASRNGLTAAGIRSWMGDFANIRNVAKYAARLGQSFGSSTETLVAEAHEVERIPDVERGSYVFSDGIGKISAEFAKLVAKKCGMRMTPSAFQIRYAGYKGVVAVDPTSSKKLSLRKSMAKFESENRKLDVLAHSKYQPCFLNRQVITLFSALGIQDYIFERKQQEALELLDGILTDPERAMEAVGLMAPGETTNLMKELLLCGYKPNKEPFLSLLLQTFRATKVFELRTKARIFVPKGRTMMGCLDETRSLEYGEVFAQVSFTGDLRFVENDLSLHGAYGSDGRTVVLTGKVVVAKNPCLHPGDLRVLTAVDVPSLRHMVDCVVFPQKGPRPHPNECSGSDLDGDMYFVSWDPQLIPRRMYPPMDYTAAPAQILDHVVGIEEVMEHFTDYIVNDSLGIIANAHTVFADKEPGKAFSPPCIELAKLFSIAVDFPKTGVPAVIPPELYAKEYPDFMEKLDKPSYESKGVIGKLYRAVRDHAPPSVSIKSFTKQVAYESYDPDMEVDGFREYLNDAFFYKGEYDFKLGNLMEHYGIKTEAEIFGGSIVKMSKMFNRFNDREALARAVRSLRKEARTWFNDGGEDDEYAKASAWYHVTYHPSYWGSYHEDLKRPHFLSFAWCVYDKLVLIKQKRVSLRTANELAGLMERGLRVSERRPQLFAV